MKLIKPFTYKVNGAKAAENGRHKRAATNKIARIYGRFFRSGALR